uniref:3FTx-Bra-26 n=1 Tax=Brachyurophis roperi TaxID=1295043 RepID=R4FI94_9SAUR
MKTLLLTLVVVTIVCLDLGYTLKCRSSRIANGNVVCEKYQTICFRYQVRPYQNIVLTRMGCSDSCPRKDAVCCSSDLCN